VRNGPALREVEVSGSEGEQWVQTHPHPNII